MQKRLNGHYPRLIVFETFCVWKHAFPGLPQATGAVLHPSMAALLVSKTLRDPLMAQLIGTNAFK